jgi:NAD(P)-dependent dehydrogenase (short-subunit alcohol dehydrogenase family)
MYKPFDLTGKVALVTGGNSGIGLGMARAIAQAGADVAIWGTNAKKNAAAKSELAAGGRKVVALECDVSDEKAVEAAFAETVGKLGRVDGCFANAGVSGRGTASFLEMSSEEWRRVLKVNLDGAFFTFRAAARHMVQRGGGGAAAHPYHRGRAALPRRLNCSKDERSDVLAPYRSVSPATLRWLAMRSGQSGSFALPKFGRAVLPRLSLKY